MRFCRWRSGRRRGGVAEIIGVILLVGLTLVAGVLLWSFHLNTPPPPPTVSFEVRSGSSSPTWGDPTDCQPTGYTLASYPLSPSQYSSWANDWYDECYNAATGNFSVLNVTELTVSGISSSAPLSLSDVDLYFICNNATDAGGMTTLVNGSFASMTWIPGLSTQPAANAPSLGYCGNFDAGGWSFIPGLTPAYGTLYNRLGFFDPITPGDQVLRDGDTFFLYLHTGGFPYTFLCVAAEVGEYPISYCPTGDLGKVLLDYDDYHGAPPWCFDTKDACSIYITYTGTPNTVLDTIPVADMAPAE
jgi:hypothetical protein